MNSLAVEPGSNGSVNVEARRSRRRRRLPGSEGEQLTIVRIEKTTSPPSALHRRQRIVQSPLRDLLQLRVDREDHVVARHRLPDHSGRRIVAASRTVLEKHRLSRLRR